MPKSFVNGYRIYPPTSSAETFLVPICTKTIWCMCSEEHLICTSCIMYESIFLIVHFYFIFSITIYPPYTLFHLHSSPHLYHQNHHRCVYPWVHFVRSLRPPKSPPSSVSPLFIYESVSYFVHWLSLLIRFYICMKSDGTCLSLTSLFHLA